MIDLYSWPTPNGRKVHIMLEEVGLDYRIFAIDIRKGDQFTPEFLDISPNNKIPAIRDHDGPDGGPFALFESGAILIYLAEKSGQLMPSAMAARIRVIEWLMFQMGGTGPMLGQAHHFRQYAPEKIPYAIERYTNEANRLYGVLNKRLAGYAWLAGDYSIADIAHYPWIRSYERQGVVLEDYGNVKRWYDAIEARDAVQRGNAVLDDVQRQPLDDAARAIMFGPKQYERR